MKTQSGKLVTGLPAILSAINRKQIPLCRFHHHEIEKGQYYPMDPDFLKEVLRTKAPAHLEEIFTKGYAHLASKERAALRQGVE